jgi:hypothetical protein
MVTVPQEKPHSLLQHEQRQCKCERGHSVYCRAGSCQPGSSVSKLYSNHTSAKLLIGPWYGFDKCPPQVPVLKAQSPGLTLLGSWDPLGGGAQSEVVRSLEASHPRGFWTPAYFLSLFLPLAFSWCREWFTPPYAASSESKLMVPLYLGLEPPKPWAKANFYTFMTSGTNTVLFSSTPNHSVLGWQIDLSDQEPPCPPLDPKFSHQFP